MVWWLYVDRCMLCVFFLLLLKALMALRVSDNFNPIKHQIKHVAELCC